MEQALGHIVLPFLSHSQPPTPNPSTRREITQASPSFGLREEADDGVVRLLGLEAVVEQQGVLPLPPRLLRTEVSQTRRRISKDRLLTESLTPHTVMETHFSTLRQPWTTAV